MNDTKYNGWTNYPTWNVKLWLDNNPYTVNTVIQLYKKAKVSQIPKFDDKDYFSRQKWTLFQFRDSLESMIRNQADQEVSGASMFTDLMRWSLNQVNWNEIATAYQEEFEHDA